MVGNYSADDALTVDLKADEFGTPGLFEHIVLHCDDLKAVNDCAQPDRFHPEMLTASSSAVLPPLSWNILRFRYS